MRFQQRDAEADVWDVVEAGKTVDYAWDEPMQVSTPEMSACRCGHHQSWRLSRATSDMKWLLPVRLCQATVESLNVEAAQDGKFFLSQAHRLRVVLDADDMAFRDTTAHEYNLDDIKVSHEAALATLCHNEV